MRMKSAVLLLLLTLILVGCQDTSKQNASTESTDKNVNSSEDVNETSTETSTESEEREDEEETEGLYLVYTEKKGDVFEYVYFGRDKDSFKRIYTEETTYNLCETKISTTTYNLCGDIRPYETGIRIGYRRGDVIYDYMNNREFDISDHNKTFIYVKDTMEFKQVDLNHLKQKINFDPQYGLLSNDATGSKFLIQDKDYNNYYYDMNTDKLTPFPEGYSVSYYNSSFDRLIGVSYNMNSLVVIERRDFSNPTTFEGVTNYRVISEDYLIYLKDDVVNLYNFTTKENLILPIEYTSYLGQYIHIFNESEFVYIQDESLYIYNFNSNEMLQTIPNINRFYIDTINDQMIIMGNNKIMWYQGTGEFITHELDYDEWTADFPIITKDILVFSAGGKEMIVHKNSGYFGEIQNDKKGRPTISYVMSENNIFVSYGDGSSYLVNETGVTELTWIKDKISKLEN